MRSGSNLLCILVLGCLLLRTLEAREGHSTPLVRKATGLKEETSPAKELNTSLSKDLDTPSSRGRSKDSPTQRTTSLSKGHSSSPSREHNTTTSRDRASSLSKDFQTQLHRNTTVNHHKETLKPIEPEKDASRKAGPKLLDTEEVELATRETESQPVEKRDTEWLNAKQLESARLEAERIQKERAAAEKIQAGMLEAERREAEGREAQRLHAEAQKQTAQVEEAEEVEADEIYLEAKAESLPQEETLPQPDLGPKPRRSKRLDIVIAHYDPQRIWHMSQFWLWFLELETVKAWKPYVFIYTQNQEETVMQDLQPFTKYGGEVVRLANAGRESHVYLQHISHHYYDLADHTMFSQDEPNTDQLPKKFERMFVEKTGYLPLSFMGHVDCFESWNNIIPPKVIPQLYGMLTHSLCPPTGYAAGFEGQFLVSRRRIQDQPLRVYQHLMDMVAAPSDHWVHEYHTFDPFKDQTNPYMGHALERAWSLAFNCYEVWRQANCYDCEIQKDMQACGRDACQCYDVD